MPPSAYGAIMCNRCRTSDAGIVLCAVNGVDMFRDHMGRLRPHPWSAVVSCRKCGRVAAVCQGEQYPPSDDWPDDRDVPAYMSGAYEEARGCLAAGYYTAATMMCRKILMNLGINHGARKGKRYAEYVDWFVEKGYITSSIKKWVEYIRDSGNKANHRPDSVGKKRAMITFVLTTELMRRVYELEHLPDEYFASYCEPRMDALPPPSMPAEARIARDARAVRCPPHITLDAYMGSASK